MCDVKKVENSLRVFLNQIYLTGSYCSVGVVSHFSENNFSNNNILEVRVIIREKLRYYDRVRVGEMILEKRREVGCNLV